MEEQPRGRAMESGKALHINVYAVQIAYAHMYHECIGRKTYIHRYTHTYLRSVHPRLNNSAWVGGGKRGVAGLLTQFCRQ